MKRTGKFIKAMAAAMAALALAACGQQEDDGAAEAKARLDQAKRAVYEKLKGSYIVQDMGYTDPDFPGTFNDIRITGIEIGGGHITLNGTERIDLEIPGDILSYEEFSESTKINLVFAYTDRADKNIENGFAVELGTHGWFYIYKSTVVNNYDLKIKQRWKDGTNQYDFWYNKAAGTGGGGEDPSPALGFGLEGTWSGEAGSASLEIGADGALSVSKNTGAMTYSDCSWSASGSTVTFRMKVTSGAGNASTTIEIEDSFTASSSDSGETMTLTLVKSRTKTTVGGSATESESADASEMLLSVWNMPQAKSVTLTKSGS